MKKSDCPCFVQKSCVLSKCNWLHFNWLPLEMDEHVVTRSVWLQTQILSCSFTSSYFSLPVIPLQVNLGFFCFPELSRFYFVCSLFQFGLSALECYQWFAACCFPLFTFVKASLDCKIATSSVFDWTGCHEAVFLHQGKNSSSVVFQVLWCSWACQEIPSF